MDSNSSVLQSGSSNRQFTGFNLLKKIDRKNFDSARLQWIWEHVQTQDYAFDDFSRGRIDWFLYQLADLNTEYFEIGDHGLFMVHLPVAGGVADVHFVVWDRNFSLHQQKEYAFELLDYLFYDVKVHRITGMIPAYNRLAPRFVTAMGFKFEGEMRESVLWKGTYYNVSVYGMLEKDYRTRRDRIQ